MVVISARGGTMTRGDPIRVAGGDTNANGKSVFLLGRISGEDDRMLAVLLGILTRQWITSPLILVLNIR